MKKLIFAVGSIAVAASTAWAQNDGSANGPYGHESEYYYSKDAYASPWPGGPAYQGFDPTAHYWDYYQLDPGHGVDVDRTTPP